MVCKLCNNKLTIRTENREDIMGQGYEYDVELGHKEGCGNTFDAKAFLDSMPDTWTAEDEAEHNRIVNNEFLESQGWSGR